MHWARTTYVSLILLCMWCAFAFAASYDDVAVIVNTRSSASLAIGSYFASARSIPSQNILTVDIDTAEEVSGATFDNLRTQIESQILARNINAQLNYLVTTKGVPLKVNRGNDAGTTTALSASVESELTCILGSHRGSIGGAGRLFSPVYNLNRHFDRSRDSILLVTRLDGYTVNDVYALIDRSGPSVSVSASSMFVFDQDPDWNSIAPTLNMYLSDATTKLQAKGQSVTLNQDTVYVTNASNLLGYVSWGSNDHHANDFTSYAMPHNSWLPGALAETYVSTSGRTFNSYDRSGQSLIADLIAEGASGAKGYVYEPFSSSMTIASILFDRYLNGYTLAESYYLSSYYLSWMEVVIGDPKTTISFAPPVALPIQLASFTAASSAGGTSVVLAWRTISETNNYGFHVERSASRTSGFVQVNSAILPGHGTTTAPQSYSFTDHSVSPGAYYYRLRQIDLSGDEHVTEPCAVTVQVSTDVPTGTEPEAFALDQNFPNPFNPATTIGFRIAVRGLVHLEVFDVLGKHVATLVNEARQPGAYTVTFNGAGLASGTYIYRLTSGNDVKMRKLVYLK